MTQSECLSMYPILSGRVVIEKPVEGSKQAEAVLKCDNIGVTFEENDFDYTAEDFALTSDMNLEAQMVEPYLRLRSGSHSSPILSHPILYSFITVFSFFVCNTRQAPRTANCCCRARLLH